MPFERKRAGIILNHEEVSYLQELSRSRIKELQTVERAKMILLYTEGSSAIGDSPATSDKSAED
jgi:hypothetical protein